MQNANDQIANQPGSRDVFFVLFKHKNKIIGFVLVVMTIAIISTLYPLTTYKSEAKLFVNLGRETLTQDSEPSSGQRIQISQSFENQINSELELLKSQELALKIVEKLGTDAFQEDSPKYMSHVNPITLKFRNTLKDQIDFLKKAMSYFMPRSEADQTSTDDIEEIIIANKLIEKLTAEVVNDSNIIKLSFESPSPQLSRDLLDILIALYMEKRTKLIGTPESFGFFKKESDRFRLELETTESMIQDLKNESGFGYESAAIAELNDGLQNLKFKEQEILSTFTVNSIPALEIRRQIQKAEKDLDELLKKNNAAEVRLTKLERKKELLEKNYRKYADTLEQTRINQALDAEQISNIKITQVPNFPIKPASPSTGIILGMGLFMALFGALGLAFFVEYFDGSLQKPEQVEEILEIPVLGSIKEMKK